MRSRDYAQTVTGEHRTIKYFGAVTTGNSAAVAYYLKPSIHCKLIGAKLYVVTAAGANLSGVGTFTKETAVVDTDLKPDVITISTNISAGTAVSNDNFLNFAVADVASATTTKVAIPLTDHAGAENDFNPDENDALLISFPATNNATLMAATLEVEFAPV